MFASILKSNFLRAEHCVCEKILTLRLFCVLRDIITIAVWLALPYSKAQCGNTMWLTLFVCEAYEIWELVESFAEVYICCGVMLSHDKSEALVQL